MEPLESGFDPWRDTEAERAPEREDPFDDGSMQGPFGTLSEIIGVPRITAGSRTPRQMMGSHTFTTVLAMLLVAVVLVSAAVTLSHLF